MSQPISESGESVSQGRNTSDPDQLPAPKRARMCNQAKHWCFTYNNFEEEHVTAIEQHQLVEAFCAQEEIGASGTRHIQGCLKFATRARPMTVFHEEHYRRIHWEICRNWSASLNYCRKAETRAPEGKRWEKNVPMTGGYGTQAGTVSTIQPRGWQARLLDRIPEMKPRKIYWYWEEEGNVGKSALIKYLCINYAAIMLSGKASDMKFAVCSCKKKPELILIDVPRSCHQYISYSGIEEVSNGCFLSTKYESGMCIFECPKIIVFANETPEYSKMSRDRWEVKHLGADELADWNIDETRRDEDV